MSRQECPVCLEIYNHEDHFPHLLTCGHSICTSCLGGLLKDQNLICPQCRTPYRGQVNSVNDVPVVYDLLPLPQESSQKTFHFDDIFRSLKETTGTSVMTLALEEQIKSLRALLSDLNAQAEINDKVREKINEQLDKNKEMVLNEIDYVMEAIDIALAAKESVMDSLQAAKEATTLTDLFPAYEEAKRCCEASEKSLQRNQMLLQRKVLENSQKAHCKYEAFLEKSDGQKEEPQPGPLLAQPSTSSWKKPKLLQGTITHDLILEALSMGEVWAVTTSRGCPRRAQISQEGCDLLLHALQDGEPSAGSTVVEYASVHQFQRKQNMSDGSDIIFMRVFLELSWGNERIEKVFIQTTERDKRAELFRHLCLGDIGPYSYVNTQLGRKRIEASGRTYVTSGGKKESEMDYLISNMNNELASSGYTVGKGTVEMSLNNGAFTIHTHCPKSQTSASNSFVGYVLKNLQLVDEITDLSTINDVQITDCGSVICSM